MSDLQSSSDRLPAAGDRPTIYVASRAKFGGAWQALRSAGHNIVSSWIDESAVGATGDWPGLWTRCVAEASQADALVLLDDEDESTQGLKGALVETGAALACGKPVFYCGRRGKYSFEHHPLIRWCESVEVALDAAVAPPAAQPRTGDGPNGAHFCPTCSEACCCAEWYDGDDCCHSRNVGCAVRSSDGSET